MEDKITLNESVKEAVTTALLRLMKKKFIEDISVKDIVEVAGVARSSFYRNFESKEDVLVKYLNKIYLKKFEEDEPFKYPEDFETMHDFYVVRFRFIKENREFFEAINRNNLFEYVYKRVDKDIGKYIFLIPETENNTVMEVYMKAKGVGVCTEITSEWINRKFRESEEEIADIFEKIM